MPRFRARHETCLPRGGSRETTMRKVLLIAATVSALAAAGSLIPDSAIAAPIGSPAGVRHALDDANIVEKAGCWRNGWHGWGWYPWCGYRHHYYRPYYR